MFSHIQEIYNDSNFVQRRNKAEKAAAEKSRNKKMTFDEIYKEMPLDMQKYKQVELDMERKTAQINP